MTILTLGLGFFTFFVPSNLGFEPQLLGQTNLSSRGTRRHGGGHDSPPKKENKTPHTQIA